MSNSEITASHGRVSLSLRALSLASLIVAIACLTTLAIVVTVKDVDILSTVALVLAILAFVVQLIVFIVQSAESNRVLGQSQALHGQMMSVLAQVQERATGTQKSVDTINTKLIEAIVGKANSEGIPVSSHEFAQEVAAVMSEAPDQGLVTLPGLPMAVHSQGVGLSRETSGLDWPDPMPGPEAAEIQREMSSWPTPQEFDKNRHLIEGLDDEALRRLHSLADDLVRSTGERNSLGPGLTAGLDEDLKKMGLVEKIPGFRLGTLSPLGRQVARILTAQGAPPPGLAKYLPLRQKAEYLQAEVEAMARRRE